MGGGWAGRWLGRAWEEAEGSRGQAVDRERTTAWTLDGIRSRLQLSGMLGAHRQENNFFDQRGGLPDGGRLAVGVAVGWGICIKKPRRMDRRGCVEGMMRGGALTSRRGAIPRLEPGWWCRRWRSGTLPRGRRGRCSGGGRRRRRLRA